MGPTLQAEWPQHLIPRRQVAEYLDASYWAASTPEGQPVGVVLIEPRLAARTRFAMLDTAIRFARLQSERHLQCLVGVKEVDGAGRWLVCDPAPAGHAGDVFALNWLLHRKLEFFFQVTCPMLLVPAGDVVVEAPKGVAEDL